MHPGHASKPVKPATPAHGAVEPAGRPGKAGKTTICHATGSAKNPYVTITISDNALPAHARHQDGRDIIPVPAGGCPRTAAGEPGAKGSETSGGRGAEVRGKAAPAAAGGVLRMFAAGRDAPAGAVLGVVAQGGALPQLRETIAEASAVERREAGTRAATSTGRPGARQLPFTGMEAALVGFLGLLLLLVGTLLRRLSAGSALAA